MNMFEWKPEYAIDHSEIDTQHQRLFELANDLYAAMLAGRGRVQMSKTLSSLVAYTRTHFAMEERLMLAHCYPDYARHKAEHEVLTGRVLDFQKAFEIGGVSVTIDLLRFLKDWLLHHISETDRKIALYLNSRAA